MSESAEALLRKRAMESMLRKKSDTTNESRSIETKDAPLPPPAGAPPIQPVVPVRVPVEEDKEDGEIEDETPIAPSQSISTKSSSLGEVANTAQSISFGIKSAKPITASKGSKLDVGEKNPLSESTKITPKLDKQVSAKVICCIFLISLDSLHFNCISCISNIKRRLSLLDF